MTKIINLLLPGLLVAATGVGAGDLITATLAGHHIGALLWLPLVGAFLKYILTEAIARYQLANEEHFIHGQIKYFGKWFKWSFLLYIFIWSYAVGGALINASANSFLNIFPQFLTKEYLSFIFSILAFSLVWSSKFKLFENIMMILISLMFISVIATSFMLLDGPLELFKGLTHFQNIPYTSPWFLSVLGGVGGTLTILCYGYWIQESNRKGKEFLRTTRIDLSISYLLTGIFSISMMIIGTKINIIGSNGSVFITQVATLFENQIGVWAAYLFRVGFFCGVFSSLLGVWQSVPYLFADLIYHPQKRPLNLKKSSAYRFHLFFLSAASLLTLTFKFQMVQLLYAVIGALFIPFCAGSLIYVNHKGIKNKLLRNSIFQNIILAITLILFVLYGITMLIKKFL